MCLYERERELLCVYSTLSCLCSDERAGLVSFPSVVLLVITCYFSIILPSLLRILTISEVAIASFRFFQMARRSRFRFVIWVVKESFRRYLWIGLIPKKVSEGRLENTFYKILAGTRSFSVFTLWYFVFLCSIRTYLSIVENGRMIGWK